MKQNRLKKTPSEYLPDELEWQHFRLEVLRRSDQELKVIQLVVAQWAEEQSERFSN